MTSPGTGANKDGTLRYRAQNADCDACGLKYAITHFDNELKKWMR